MRNLIVTENMTLDGVIDAGGGWFDPTDEEVDQADVLEATREHSAAADAFLAGRQTFEDMRGFWPEQTGDTTGVTDYLNRVAKYVVSRTMQDPGWDNSTVLAGDLTEEVTALKDRPGQDIVVTGSITLVHALTIAGLVDEYRLFVYPVVVGSGRRLFADGTDLPALRLAENRAFRSGVVLLRYRTDA